MYIPNLTPAAKRHLMSPRASQADVCAIVYNFRVPRVLLDQVLPRLDHNTLVRCIERDDVTTSMVIYILRHEPELFTYTYASNYWNNEENIWLYRAKFNWTEFLRWRILTPEFMKRLHDAGYLDAVNAFIHRFISWEQLIGHPSFNMRVATQLIETAHLNHDQILELLKFKPSLLYSVVVYQQCNDEIVSTYPQVVNYGEFKFQLPYLRASTVNDLLTTLNRQQLNRFLQDKLGYLPEDVDIEDVVTRYMPLLNNKTLFMVLQSYTVSEAFIYAHANRWTPEHWETLLKYNLVSLDLIQTYRAKLIRNYSWYVVQERQPLTYRWIIDNMSSLDLDVVCQNPNLRLTAEERDSLNVLVALTHKGVH